MHPCQFYDKNTLLTLLEYGFIIIVCGTIHYLKMNLQLNMELFSRDSDLTTSVVRLYVCDQNPLIINKSSLISR